MSTRLLTRKPLCGRCEENAATWTDHRYEIGHSCRNICYRCVKIAIAEIEGAEAKGDAHGMDYS